LPMARFLMMKKFVQDAVQIARLCMKAVA